MLIIFYYIKSLQRQEQESFRVNSEDLINLNLADDLYLDDLFVEDLYDIELEPEVFLSQDPVYLDVDLLTSPDIDFVDKKMIVVEREY